MTTDATHRFDSLDHEERDALASAYALGELEGAEREFVERLLADPAADDVRRIVAETRAVAAALRTGRAEEVPPRAPNLRRAVVAALAATPAATSPAPRPERSRLPVWFALAGALAATVLVAVTMIPSVRSNHEVARRLATTQPRPAEQAGQTMATGGAARPAAKPDVGPAGIVVADEQNVTADTTLAKPVDRLARATPVPAATPAGPQAKRAAAAPAASVAVETEQFAEESLEDLIVSMPVIAGKSSGSGGRAAPARSPGDAALGQGQPSFSDAEAPADKELRRRNEASSRRLGGERDTTDRERYARFEENRFLTVADRPLSTFSIDVDTASYAVVRRFLAAGRRPPADAVRLEEFVNYFRYAYPQPAGDDPFAVALEAADCPWRPGHRLVRIGIAGRDIDRTKRPSGNLVFLIDVSGSMGDPDKLPLVKQALAMLVAELTENDRVSIVTYAGDAGLKLPPTSGDQKQKILDVIEGLSAGGSTHGSAGIELAYAQAQERFIAGGANRVILCTDGDLNVGVTSDAALVALVQEKARGGTFLTVLGFGQGNLQDAKMEAIADKGNGVYAYVDGVREARKVLVEQLTGSTITIAKDVKIQVEFNPAEVASYRLLGYENRRLADTDFRDDTKDAGEIGAGHTVTALYEIVPAGAATTGGDGPGAGAEPLKYQPQPEQPRAVEPAPAAGPASGELLTVKLRFKQPEGDVSVLREFPLADEGGSFAAASADTRFAAAVAAFGMLLRDSAFTGDATFATVAQLAATALGPDEGGYRAEFLDLVRKAEMIAGTERR
ncbi:MAG: von Willebrand factor type A domain-containing protein [Planctomycetaceae bacterium]